MDTNEKKPMNKGVVWIVVAVLVIAGIVIYAMQNDTPLEEAEEAFEEAAEKFGQSAEQVTAQLKARADLIALRAEITSEAMYADAADGVEEIRAELKAGYKDAQGEVKAGWESFDADFEVLIEELKAKASTAMDSLANLIVRLNLKAK